MEEENFANPDDVSKSLPTPKIFGPPVTVRGNTPQTNIYIHKKPVNNNESSAGSLISSNNVPISDANSSLSPPIMPPTQPIAGTNTNGIYPLSQIISAASPHFSTHNLPPPTMPNLESFTISSTVSSPPPFPSVTIPPITRMGMPTLPMSTVPNNTGPTSVNTLPHNKVTVGLNASVVQLAAPLMPGPPPPPTPIVSTLLPAVTQTQGAIMSASIGPPIIPPPPLTSFSDLSLNQPSLPLTGPPDNSNVQPPPPPPPPTQHGTIPSYMHPLQLPSEPPMDNTISQPSTYDSRMSGSPMSPGSLYSDDNWSGPITPAPQRVNRFRYRRGAPSRIDPAQMPRPPLPVDGGTYQTRSLTHRRIPPTSSVNFKVIDTGNASPRFIRTTLCAPPTTKDILNELNIPFAVVCTPFADHEATEEPVPRVKSSDSEGPVRCKKCNGYMNAFVTWLDGGSSWSCNLCNELNVTPPWYFCSLDGMGTRLDKPTREELNRGTVDFVVGQDYCQRPPQEPIFVFALDVSPRALATGFTSAGIQAIRTTMSDLPGGADTRVGILTFDSHVHFYVIRRYAKEKLKLMAIDPEDPTPALPASDWIFPLVSHQDLMDEALSKVSELISISQRIVGSQPTQSCPGSALRAAQRALVETGGRIVLLTACHPVLGFGRVFCRESTSHYGTESEIALYGDFDIAASFAKTQAERDVFREYNEMRNEMCATNVCVDVFISGEGDDFKDNGILGELTQKTGGNLRVIYGDLTVPENASHLEQELLKSTMAMRASEGLVKLRLSRNFRVVNYIGKGVYNSSNGEIQCNGFDSEDTSCWVLKHETALKEDEKVYLQLAVLCTDMDRKRIIRVINICYSATADFHLIYRSSDTDAVVTTIHKIAVQKAMTKSLTQRNDGPRDYLNTMLTEFLYKYRVHCSSHSPRGQLILPESLKLLPLYIMGILKHPILLENSGTSGTTIQMRYAVRGHERAYELRRALCMNPKMTLNVLYPRLFAMHLLDDDESVPYETDGQWRMKLPHSMPPTSEILDADGIYILDDGTICWLYIGRAVATELIEGLFNVYNHDRPSHITLKAETHLDPDMDFIREHVVRMMAILNELRLESTRMPVMRVIWGDRPSDNGEASRFSLRLVEDSIYGVLSYVDFLCKMHTMIQAKL